MATTQDKGTALVTGASSGIGAIYADRLAKRGYDLILVARNKARLATLSRRLRNETGRSVETVAADLTTSADLRRIENILRSDSRITTLVNNAGVGSAVPLLDANVDKMEVYVRPFDANKPEAPAGPAVQVSKSGALGMVSWRQDGKEMYFLTRDWEVMAVDITTAPAFQAGIPKLLFKLPGPMPGNPAQWKNVSSDGQRFIFAMPAK